MQPPPCFTGNKVLTVFYFCQNIKSVPNTFSQQHLALPYDFKETAEQSSSPPHMLFSVFLRVNINMSQNERGIYMFKGSPGFLCEYYTPRSWSYVCWSNSPGEVNSWSNFGQTESKVWRNCFLFQPFLLSFCKWNIVKLITKTITTTTKKLVLIWPLNNLLNLKLLSDYNIKSITL